MRRWFTLSLLALVVGAFSSPAQSAVMVNVREAADGVVATGSGTIDLTALDIYIGVGSSAIYMFPQDATLILGTSSARFREVAGGISGPDSFGTGFGAFAASGDGDMFGISYLGFPGMRTIRVPEGYTSGDPLSAEITFPGKTLADFGMSQGSFVWSWGSGSSADSFTLTVVPEPSTASLTGIGLLAFGSMGRRRRILLSSD